MMGWVTAHEFFHLARNHEHFLQKDDRLVRALEFDADCMAVAAVYMLLHRSPQFNVPGGGRGGLKAHIFQGIYWPIRSEFRSAIEQRMHTKTHPSWFFRLYNCLLKVAMIEVVDASMAARPGWMAEKVFLEELGPLLELLWGLEKEFALLHNEPLPSSFRSTSFGAYVWGSLEGQSETTILSTWQSIEPEVSKRQYLAAMKRTQAFGIASEPDPWAGFNPWAL